MRERQKQADDKKQTKRKREELEALARIADSQAKPQKQKAAKSHQQTIKSTNEEVMDGFVAVVEKLLPPREEQEKATEELAHNRSGKGLMCQSSILAAAKRLPGHLWRSTYGASYPTLQKVAVRVLSQVSSACACERNWSNYDFIHNRKRNRLQPERADDIVYVFSNLRLANKVFDVEYEEKFLDWVEVEGEDSDDYCRVTTVRLSLAGMVKVDTQPVLVDIHVYMPVLVDMYICILSVFRWLMPT
jgi:hypothetical protein